MTDQAVPRYRSCRLVLYEVPSSSRDMMTLQSLQMRVDFDLEFLEDLIQDPYLSYVFSFYYQGKTWEEKKGRYSTTTILYSIIRALNNKAKFAIVQKLRLKENLHLVQPLREQLRVCAAVNDELSYVSELIQPYTKVSEDLTKYHAEIGRLLKERNAEVPSLAVEGAT